MSGIAGLVGLWVLLITWIVLSVVSVLFAALASGCRRLGRSGWRWRQLFAAQQGKRA